MNVVFLEASSGSVVGGSLTGMLELLRGIDRSRISPAVVLYEQKSCIPHLEADGYPVSVFRKSRLPKEHALQDSAGFARAKNVGAVAQVLANARTVSTLLLETYPAAWRLVELLRGYRPDLVYVCNGFRGNADAILASWMLGVPCVVHAKGFDKFSWVERRLSRLVAGCVSMTRAIEEHCRAGGMKPGFFDVIYDGLDLEAFQPRLAAPEARALFGLAADDEVVGVVGNIQEWKGQHVLVEALDLLKEARPKLHVLLVGGVHRSGEAYAARLRETIAARGLEGRVHWTGPRPDVPDLMNAMDVVVHTSVRGEPFGRVIIEAMAVGKAVVATKAGGVPEFTQDGVDAVLLPPGDAGALAACLDRLLGDADARTALERGARASAQRFALARHTDAMTDVFARAIALKAGTAGAARSAGEPA